MGELFASRKPIGVVETLRFELGRALPYPPVGADQEEEGKSQAAGEPAGRDGRGRLGHGAAYRPVLSPSTS